MNDPRLGLTRRYNGVDEILEANGGKKRIQGTNFNALRTLKDPLYVKYAEQLRQESKDSMNARLDHEEFANMLRRFTSENGINHDIAESIIRGAPKSESDDEPVRVDKDPKDEDDDDMDTDEGGDGDDDDFDDGFNPMGGDNRPPRRRRDTQKRTPKPSDDQTQLPRGDGGGYNGGPPPPTPPDWGGESDKASQLFRNNLALEAQIAELREEIKRAARKQEAAEAVKAAIPRDNVTKEIIRELHQVPVAVPQQDPQVLSLLAQAMSSNQTMAAYAQQMGMTIVQFMTWARGQMNTQTQAAPASYRIDTPKPPPKPPAPEIAVSQTSPPPPPPPPASKKIRVASPEIAKAKAVPPEAPPPRPSAAQPKPSAARPEAPKPKPSAAPAEVPVSRSRSRAASAATVDYGDTKLPESRAPSRNPSVATVGEERSRSRTAAQEIVPNPRIILPIREEGRGRSPPRAQKIMEAIHTSQSRELVKGQMRQELGRFARAFAAKRREEPPPRAPSVPTLPKTKTFDEIVAITEAREDAIREKAVPFGAARQKQRTSSLGDARVRFQGRPIVG